MGVNCVKKFDRCIRNMYKVYRVRYAELTETRFDKQIVDYKKKSTFYSYPFC